MAVPDLSPALRAPASSRPHPMAKPGYGKRSMPGQLPRRADDFALLPARERCIAGFIDQLPDGAAMDGKTLAKQLPLYGQQAVASALRALAAAGHLRRVRCLVVEQGQVRWVSRTFWSRTAHDNEWWAATETDRTSAPTTAPPPPPRAPQEEPDRVGEPVSLREPVPVCASVPVAVGPASAPTPVPQQRATAPAAAAPAGPSPAYLALARLGREDARLALSAADCAALEARATEWLARGVNTDYLVQTLAAGLPAHVGSPVGFLRHRLTDRIPPHVPSAPAPATPDAPVHQVMLECTECGVPGRSEALPDGLCHPCRQAALDLPTTPPMACADIPGEDDVRSYVADLRNLLRAP